MESRRYDRGRICDSPPEPPSPPSYSTQSRISCELSTQRSYKANSRQSPSYTEYSNKHNTVRSAQEVGMTTSSSSSSSHDKRRKRHKRSREGSSDGSRKYSRRRRSKSRSRSRGVRSKSPGARSRSRGNRSRSPAVRSRSRGGRSKSRERYRNNSYSRSYSRSPSQHSRGYSRSHSRSRSRSRSNGHTNRPRDSGRDSRYRDSRSRHYRTSSHDSDYIPDIIDQQLGMPATQITQPVIPIQSNAFKNDGSFMEMFKKMQEKMQPSAEQSATSILEDKPVVPPPLMVGKRRGGRILKTGMVAKAKTEQVVEQPKDAWSLYMAEVKKYREVCCQEEDNTRPLISTATMAYGGIPEDIENYQSAPYDPRFPNTNQTRHCYQYYLDFHRCKKVRGEEFEACKYFKRIYTIMCPRVWTEKWDEQIAEGRFPGRI